MPLSAIALFSVFAIAAAAAGVGALALWPARVRQASDLMEAAAGGALLVMGLGFLAVEAVELNPAALPLIAAGVALGAALQGGARLAGGARAATLTLLTGLGLHTFLDGAAFTVSLSADPAFGLGSALGMVIHDAPKALLAFVLFQRAGMSARVSGAGAVAVAGGLSALGAFATIPAVEGLTLQSLGALIALAAGLLTWSGAACLYTAFRRPSASKALAVAASAGLVAVIGWAGHAWDHASAEGVQTAAHVPGES